MKMRRGVRSQSHFERLWLKCLRLAFLALALFQTGTVFSEQPVDGELADTRAMVERLSKTNLLNSDEIYAQLKLVRSESPRQFVSANPYKPRYRLLFERLEDIEKQLPINAQSYQVDEAHRRFTFFGQESVLIWHNSLTTNNQVCAVRFVDSHQVDYILGTFSSSHDALADDFVITHRYHCGTCSSLRNLAIYLSKRDLTTPARSCARKLTLHGIKKCLMETIGFEEQCAETWAYNVAHTKRQCWATCAKHYGLWRVLRNNMGDAHVGDSGELNPCLACDEYISGPGFRYAAGRTRRTSGLVSTIERSQSEIYPVDQSLYFK